MPKTLRLACIAFAVAVIAGLPAYAPARADTVSGSIAYDKLNLATPDAALRTLLTAYRDGDFVTVYWIFAYSTQQGWLQQFLEFRMNGLVRNFDLSNRQIVDDMMPAGSTMDQTDNSFLFATVMVGAKRHGMLPLDLAGLPADLSQQSVPDLGKRTQTTTGDVDFAVRLKNYGSPVIFRMQLAKSGRWRLLQIIPPGGDEKSIPFGLSDK